MVYLAQSQNPMAQLIQTILDIFSVFVAVVLACLILYANTFLIADASGSWGPICCWA